MEGRAGPGSDEARGGWAALAGGAHKRGLAGALGAARCPWGWGAKCACENEGEGTSRRLNAAPRDSQDHCKGRRRAVSWLLGCADHVQGAVRGRAGLPPPGGPVQTAPAAAGAQAQGGTPACSEGQRARSCTPPPQSAHRPGGRLPAALPQPLSKPWAGQGAPAHPPLKWARQAGARHCQGLASLHLCAASGAASAASASLVFPMCGPTVSNRTARPASGHFVLDQHQWAPENAGQSGDDAGSLPA